MTSAIHDLGYKRYVGTRRSRSTRWRVIARQQLAAAWRSWWRWKLAAFLAVIVTSVAGVWIFAFSDRLSGMMGREVPIALANLALPLAFSYSCGIAFVASLTVGASIVAGDVQSGAFVFYFARSTRPIDYLAGKLAGYGLVIASIAAGAPTLVAIMHVALSTGRAPGALASELVLVAEALGLGLLATLAYTAIPLAFSALTGARRYALGLWAAYYLIAGNIALGAGAAGNIGWLRALDVKQSLTSLANGLFDLPPMLGGRLDVPPVAAVVSIVGQSALAIGLVYWKLSTAQKAGVGGAT